MSIGLILLILLVLRYETSFDTWHRKNIYQIESQIQTPQGVAIQPGVAFPTGAALRLDYPELPKVASILQTGAQMTEPVSGKKFQEDNVYDAEPAFFEVFDFPWLAGNPKSALNEPNEVVLTKTIAEKYFGNWRNAMGKLLISDNKHSLRVTGILEDPPVNTDFPLGVVISYATLKNTNLKSNLDDWSTIFSDHRCYVVLPDNMTKAHFEADLKTFWTRHKPADSRGTNILLPLSELHFDANADPFSNQTFSKELINALGLIGLFLLVLACVNFINMATAQAVTRSKEVGIRKTLGSRRPQLIAQFLGEVFLISLAALVMAVIIARLMEPYLDRLIGTHLTTNFLSDPAIAIFLTGTLITTTLLSGFYPALVLSGFHPIQALKSKIRTGGVTLRRGLVVFQFSIAQTLTLGTIILLSQMNLFRNTPLGFKKDAIINISNPDDSASLSKIDALRNQLKAVQGVKDVSFSFASPSDNHNWTSDFKFDHSSQKSNFEANLKWADPEYFSLYNIPFVAGHAYEPTDTVRGFVVNQTFLKKVGIRDPNEALGKEINFWDNTRGPIVGVVKDFNSRSLHTEMQPVAMAAWKALYQTLNVKIEGTGSLPKIESIWKETYPAYVYQYEFLDKKLESFYKDDDRLSQLYKLFAGIALFISCLGLYGLVSFMAVQRTKEVGIRKVLGATVMNIVYLFSREFTILVGLSFLIAAPIGWYLMHRWLQQFSYRVHPGVTAFGATLLGSMVIAWLTVGYKSIKAALASPVKSLKAE